MTPQRSVGKLGIGEAELPLTLAQALAMVRALRIAVTLVALLKGAERFPRTDALAHSFANEYGDGIGLLSPLADDLMVPDSQEGALLRVSADRRAALLMVPFSAGEWRLAGSREPSFVGERVADGLVQLVVDVDGQVALEDGNAVSRVLELGEY